MRINHNISAINTNRLLASNNGSTSKNLEKLSSGLSINRAGDNAAGLAISEKMRAQIRGLNQAADNANDGISLIQTAEGGLNETHAILQRMRELAVQSANDTNTDSDRKEIQKEVDQLATEITRISTDTEFNTKKLLDGSMGVSATSSDTTNFTASVTAGANLASGTYTVSLECTNAKAATEKTPAVEKVDATVDTLTVADQGKFNTYATGLADGAVAVKFDKTAGKYYKSDGTTEIGDSDWSSIGLTKPDPEPGTDTEYKITKAYVAPKDAVMNDDAENATVKVTGIKDAENNDVSKNAITLDLTATGLAKTDLSGTTSLTVTVDSSKALTFHIGANSGQNTKLTIQNMSANALGVDAIDLTSQSSSDAAIATIDNAINQVSTQRSALGAMQNRLEHTINNLGTSSENLSAAESQIRDVDMAEEMSNYTKNNILVQAATAMLAQANQQPQNVLSLLQ